MSIISLIIYILILISVTFGIYLVYQKRAMYTMILVIFNFVIFILMFGTLYFNTDLTIDVFTEFGFSANYLVGKSAGVWTYTIDYTPWKLTTIFTHMYIHSGPFHIISNMFFLFLVGVPLEGKIGSWVFMAIYFVSGVFASIFSGLFSLYAADVFNLSPYTIGIGASGAIFGVLGAYVATYPNDKILFPLIIIRKYPVWVIAGIYFFLETVLASAGTNDHVGHFAHIGGFVGGLFFAPVIRRIKFVRDESRALDTLDLEVLEGLAKTYRQKELLDKIKKETEADIRQLWLQEFIGTIKCPECGKKLQVKPHAAKCSCGFKMKY
jgi:membrane associated rhomboid family serine protease